MKSKKRDSMGTFGTGRGVYITNAVKDSLAYQCLSPVERLVLCDMIRAYNHASSGDRVSIAQAGFRYSYGDCRELLDSKTFITARRAVCAKGFFRQAVELQKIAAGAPSIFVAASAWMKYTPTGEEARRLETRRKRKASTLRRGHERKTAFIQNGGRDDG